MDFLKSFLQNLFLLVVIGIGLLILFPDMMRQVFELYGVLFGPGLILILVATALPRRSRRR
ncbi:MAG TPA: hypothetical protein VHO48_16345 [Anaerolineaceae bacterium]|nr:hypothetical protein [Anaerolineaceae bacterium]